MRRISLVTITALVTIIAACAPPPGPGPDPAPPTGGPPAQPPVSVGPAPADPVIPATPAGAPIDAPVDEPPDDPPDQTPEPAVEIPPLHQRGPVTVERYVAKTLAAPADPPAEADAKADAKAMAQDRKMLDAEIKKLEKAWKKDKAIANGLDLAAAYTRRAAVAAKPAKTAAFEAKALKVYKTLAADDAMKNEARYDELLFSYGYSLQKDGKAQEARQLYHQLIKDFPQSNYIPEAYLAFADYYFDANELDNAQRFYDKVLQFPKSTVYYYALYKKGWVYMNLAQHQDALESFFKVITTTKDATDSATQNINRNAKRDFVLAYAEVGKAEKAHMAFKRVDAAAAFDMLVRLGDIYESQGKPDKTVYVRRELLQLDPKHPHVCRFQLSIVESVAGLGTLATTVKELDNLGALYRHLLDEAVLSAEELTYCAARAEQLMASYAREWHIEMLRTDAPEHRPAVVEAYDVYLATFPSGAEAERSAYYRAEMLWLVAAGEGKPRRALTRWSEAAGAFATYAMSKAKHERKEAIAAAVLAYTNALAIGDAMGGAPTTLRKEAASLGNWVLSKHASHPNAAEAKALADTP